MSTKQQVKIQVDATEVSALLNELYGLVTMLGPPLHPYYNDLISQIFTDSSHFIEVTTERDQMVLRPKPEALAALVSLRAARGRPHPEAWNPGPAEPV